MRIFILLRKFWFFLTLALLSMSAMANNCIPQTHVTTKLVPGVLFYTVEGELATFNPCHSSVRININNSNPKAPLFILIHGGTGLADDIRNLSASLLRLGYSTIYFDSFQMNNLYPRNIPWYLVGNEAKQRMLFQSNLALYNWVTENFTGVDNIYVYGISNGATAAVNMAGVKGLIKMRGVFAEGMPTLGLGLPDETLYPVRLIYGKLDAFAAKSPNEKLWTRRNPCVNNVDNFNHPLGNSQACSPKWGIYSTDYTEEPIHWFNRLSSKSYDVDIWWLEETAHSLFVGNLIKNSYNGIDARRIGWLGGSEGDRRKFLDLINGFVTLAN